MFGQNSFSAFSFSSSEENEAQYKSPLSVKFPHFLFSQKELNSLIIELKRDLGKYVIVVPLSIRPA